MKVNAEIEFDNNELLDKLADRLCDKILERLPDHFTNNSPAVDDRLLTKKEVQELFQISSTSIWMRQKDGTLPYIKIGRRVYFKKSVLDEKFKGNENL